MAKGDRFPPEGRTFRDPDTGVSIRQLTNHKGHSHPLYFTNSSFYDDGRRMLFGSDRHNRSNLFSIELATGEITQVTDVPVSPAVGTSFLSASVNPIRDEAYFWQGQELIALELHSSQERVLYRAPPGFSTDMTSVSADGRHLCTSLYEDLSSQFPVDLLNGYVGFRQYWEARPLSLILQVDIATGSATILFEERCWIGHCNASPKLPHLLTFCHEGPWRQVGHRIWGLDMRTGRVWKIRPTVPGERVGHEYWLADGENVAYHGWSSSGQALHGRVRFDDTNRTEAAISANSTHFHSQSLDLLVGDGSRDYPKLLLWRPRTEGEEMHFEGPRVLLSHRGSFQTQVLHVHPRLSARGDQVLFASDMSGYGNLYLADIPDFESLPPARPGV